MTIFDGYQLADLKKQILSKRVEAIKSQNKLFKIAAILYAQDAGSNLYTNLKHDAAKELGIEYQVHEFDLSGGVEPVLKKIKDLNQDQSVTGIIIQKPTRKTWAEINHVEGKPKDIKKAYDLWWRLQTSQIDSSKDVDGLNPNIIELIKVGQVEEKGRVLPATARAVLEILQQASMSLSSNEKPSSLDFIKDKKIIVLGKSDLLGQPLFYYFKQQGIEVEMIGSKELQAKVDQNKNLFDADIIISATGRKNLITGELLRDSESEESKPIVIDVGEPQADVDFESVKDKVSFITPVPGGVGPMTIVCLLENCVDLGS